MNKADSGRGGDNNSIIVISNYRINGYCIEGQRTLSSKGSVVRTRLDSKETLQSILHAHSA